jgi:hypothetical protein
MTYSDRMSFNFHPAVSSLRAHVVVECLMEMAAIRRDAKPRAVTTNHVNPYCT